MDNHYHSSGLDFWTIGLCAFVFIGLLNLLAMRFPNNKLSQTYLYIMAPGAPVAA